MEFWWLQTALRLVPTLVACFVFAWAWQRYHRQGENAEHGLVLASAFVVMGVCFVGTAMTRAMALPELNSYFGFTLSGAFLFAVFYIALRHPAG